MASKVTADMVREVASTGRERAEKIAAYATARVGGMQVRDAAREAGAAVSTAWTYQKWLAPLVDRFDLPEPPGPVRISHVSHREYRDAGRSGAHQRHHVAKGVVSPTCPLCQGDAS